MRTEQKRDVKKYFFLLPNAVFELGLHVYELAIYAYLLRIEDRRTWQCVVSYPAIADKLGISVNTVAKYVGLLEEHGLITTERTDVFTKDGLKRNGCLRYTILPDHGLLRRHHAVAQRIGEDARIVGDTIPAGLKFRFDPSGQEVILPNVDFNRLLIGITAVADQFVIFGSVDPDSLDVDRLEDFRQRTVRAGDGRKHLHLLQLATAQLSDHPAVVVYEPAGVAVDDHRGRRPVVLIGRKPEVSGPFEFHFDELFIRVVEPVFGRDDLLLYDGVGFCVMSFRIHRSGHFLLQLIEGHVGFKRFFPDCCTAGCQKHQKHRQ